MSKAVNGIERILECVPHGVVPRCVSSRLRGTRVKSYTFAIMWTCEATHRAGLKMNEEKLPEKYEQYDSRKIVPSQRSARPRPRLGLLRQPARAV